MIPSILAWIPVFFAFPDLRVNWVEPQGIRVIADGRQELLERCIESGTEVRYRFRLRYCRRRVGWFDDCSSEKTEIHSLRYDPIGESYIVESDRFADDDPPEKNTYSSLPEARADLVEIKQMSLNFISAAAVHDRGARRYIGVRVTADCKREVGDVLLDLPYLLTFGLVKTSRFDSGWIAYEMEQN
ncbi:MAG: DUF4390 domain-containing protein [Deltaproteobacteria bacterium]|nr:DUF4390 domain-containing protein [Deltaproteobacteria bacterium]